MPKRKKTRAKFLVDAGKNYTPEKAQQEILPGITAEARTKVLSLIENFGTTEFELEDPRAPVAYTYSIIARTEELYAKLKDKLDSNEESSLSKQDYKDLISQLIKLSHLSTTLSKQMEQFQKVQESRQRQQLMSMPIAEHAAILEVILGSFSTALVQYGLPEEERLTVFQNFDNLQKNYPIIDADLGRLRERLFGMDNILDADYELVDTDVQTTAKKLNEKLTKTKRQKVKK